MGGDDWVLHEQLLKGRHRGANEVNERKRETLETVVVFGKFLRHEVHRPMSRTITTSERSLSARTPKLARE